LLEISFFVPSAPDAPKACGRRGFDLVAVCDERSWFTYYRWKKDRIAPDYARCVAIHRKPGYDPGELFVSPKIRFPKAAVARRLMKKMLGFRMLMDVIPLDASLVKGSHGCIPKDRGTIPSSSVPFRMWKTAAPARHRR
jgi:hypothetical protein